MRRSVPDRSASAGLWGVEPGTLVSLTNPTVRAGPLLLPRTAPETAYPASFRVRCGRCWFIPAHLRPSVEGANGVHRCPPRRVPTKLRGQGRNYHQRSRICGMGKKWGKGFNVHSLSERHPPISPIPVFRVGKGGGEKLSVPCPSAGRDHDLTRHLRNATLVLGEVEGACPFAGSLRSAHGLTAGVTKFL